MSSSNNQHHHHHHQQQQQQQQRKSRGKRRRRRRILLPKSTASAASASRFFLVVVRLCFFLIVVVLLGLTVVGAADKRGSTAAAAAVLSIPTTTHVVLGDEDVEHGVVVLNTRKQEGVITRPHRQQRPVGWSWKTPFRFDGDKRRKRRRKSDAKDDTTTTTSSSIPKDDNANVDNAVAVAVRNGRKNGNNNNDGGSTAPIHGRRHPSPPLRPSSKRTTKSLRLRIVFLCSRVYHLRQTVTTAMTSEEWSVYASVRNLWSVLFGLWLVFGSCRSETALQNSIAVQLGLSLRHYYGRQRTNRLVHDLLTVALMVLTSHVFQTVTTTTPTDTIRVVAASSWLRRLVLVVYTLVPIGTVLQWIVRSVQWCLQVVMYPTTRMPGGRRRRQNKHRNPIILTAVQQQLITVSMTLLCVGVLVGVAGFLLHLQHPPLSSSSSSSGSSASTIMRVPVPALLLAFVLDSTPTTPTTRTTTTVDFFVPLVLQAMGLLIMVANCILGSQLIVNSIMDELIQNWFYMLKRIGQNEYVPIFRKLRNLIESVFSNLELLLKVYDFDIFIYIHIYSSNSVFSFRPLFLFRSLWHNDNIRNLQRMLVSRNLHHTIFKYFVYDGLQESVREKLLYPIQDTLEDISSTTLMKDMLRIFNTIETTKKDEYYYFILLMIEKIRLLNNQSVLTATTTATTTTAGSSATPTTTSNTNTVQDRVKEAVLNSSLEFKLIWLIAIVGVIVQVVVINMGTIM